MLRGPHGRARPLPARAGMVPVTPASGSQPPATTGARGLRLLWFAALLWVGALGCLVTSFAFVGERAWPVVLLLFLPRHPWVLPGLLLLPFALRPGRRALLWPLALGAAIWLFPIMGFVAPGSVARTPGPVLRVLSYNTTHAAEGVESLRALLLETRPDLVLFQWSSHLAHEAMSGPQFEGWAVRRVGQFTVASRFPIVSLEAVGIPSGSGPPARMPFSSRQLHDRRLLDPSAIGARGGRRDAQARPPWTPRQPLAGRSLGAARGTGLVSRGAGPLDRGGRGQGAAPGADRRRLELAGRQPRPPSPSRRNLGCLRAVRVGIRLHLPRQAPVDAARPRAARPRPSRGLLRRPAPTRLGPPAGRGRGRAGPSGVTVPQWPPEPGRLRPTTQPCHVKARRWPGSSLPPPGRRRS